MCECARRRQSRFVLLAVMLVACGCRSRQRDPNTVVFLIESSPAGLDPRIGTDGMSEHIDELIFKGLVARFHFSLHAGARGEVGSA